MKGAATAQGEIVQVDGGGQILRATGRKDRHSKVYTAKGPRDRRVRLSAHTAIQFYDVQDRLGYDRPSKAVDWLIRKARAAIDRLNDPPQHPTPESNPSSADPRQSSLEQQQAQVLSQYDFRPSSSSSNNNNNNNNNNASYMGGADLMSTMKSLFPTSSFAGFDNDPCQAPSFPARDLGLSLQTLQADGGGNPDNPFQGNFHWGGGGGFSQFSHQRELLQSNAAAAASLWNQRPLIPANNHDHEQPRFELGFRVPARIYGEEEAAENHR